eukprot:5336917-Amphidinium_carterae.1
MNCGHLDPIQHLYFARTYKGGCYDLVTEHRGSTWDHAFHRKVLQKSQTLPSSGRLRGNTFSRSRHWGSVLAWGCPVEHSSSKLSRGPLLDKVAQPCYVSLHGTLPFQPCEVCSTMQGSVILDSWSTGTHQRQYEDDWQLPTRKHGVLGN